MSLDKSEEKVSRTPKQATTDLCYLANNTKQQPTVIIYPTWVFCGLKYTFPAKSRESLLFIICIFTANKSPWI